MLLDDSGSMKSTLWNQLIDSFSKFLRAMSSNVNIKAASKITVITHDE